MALTTSQGRFARLLFYVVVVALLFLSLRPVAHIGSPPPVEIREDASGLHAISNGTLGVGRVFAVNLPSRPDKRDNLILGSSVSGFHIDFMEGITPDQISPQSYPYNWDYKHLPSEYAARRAHLNAIQRVVDEGLGSAIIMEDDADWDVTIKTQLQTFAVATRALQGAKNESTDSPYGDDWDILWLGHCGVECRRDASFFLTPNDPTILPPHHFLPYWRDPPSIDKPDHARLTCAASDGVCSIVYAVSYRGARRILAALSVNPTGLAEKIEIGAQFDVSLGRLCGIGYLKCFAPYPSLTGGYITSSDIHGDRDSEEPRREKPSSYGLMYSTMMNINRILNGDAMVQSTWDDAEVPTANPDDIKVLGGKMLILGERGLYWVPVEPQ